ncbi:unnamed protein product, partial [Hymenolepis diminuta]
MKREVKSIWDSPSLYTVRARAVLKGNLDAAHYQRIYPRTVCQFLCLQRRNEIFTFASPFKTEITCH